MMKYKTFIFIITAIIIFILGLIAHVQYFKTKRHIIEFYSEKQMALARQASVSLGAFIKNRMQAIEVLADMPASRNLDRQIFLSEYQRTYEKVTGFDFIIFVDQNGDAQVGYPAKFPCPSKQSPEVWTKFIEAFETAKNERKTVILSKDVLVNGKAFICLITPIYSFKNKVQGAVLGVINVNEALKEALQPIFKEHNNYIWVLNEEGYLLYHPNHEDMLLRNVIKTDQSCYECHQRFTFEEQMLTNEIGVGIKQNRGLPRVMIGYAQMPLQNTRLIIAVSSPFSQLTVSIRNQFISFLLLVIFMMFAIVISAILISRINKKHIIAQAQIKNLKAQAHLIQEKKAAESRYRILVEQSPDPIFLWTRKRLIMVNHSFEQLFGYHHDEVCNEGFSITDLIDPKSVENYNKEVEALIKGEKEIASIAIGMRNKAGDVLSVEISLGRFTFGRVVVFQGIIHDITKISQLEREREQRKHLALIGEMAARIAHEIKNPLASMQTGIQLLESQLKNGEKQKGYYERLRGEIQRVDKILKGLLTYAREDHLDARLTDIIPLIRRFKELIGPTLEKQGLQLETHLEQDLPLIFIDEQKIEQVLWNVMLNATQASHSEGKIYIDVVRNKGGVEVRIRDQGIGIPEDALKKIFQPYFSTKPHGSGLGLAISKKIVELHRGQISVESKPDHGTTVIIFLPAGEAKT